MSEELHDLSRLAPETGMMYLAMRGRVLHRCLSEIGTVPMVVTGTYNPHLVALSILVAAFASYTALDIGGRVAATRGAAPRVWLVVAAIAMGGGIWSMHFIGMLAFNLPTPMSY